MLCHKYVEMCKESSCFTFISLKNIRKKKNKYIHSTYIKKTWFKQGEYLKT